MKKHYSLIFPYLLRRIFFVFLVIMTSHATAQVLAFPGAEGFGRFATGGRGGKVYEVTNLNDSGSGSLRDGVVSFPGEPVTIIFKVGGTINLLSQIKITRSNLTIAGQTAPGDGICLKGHSFILNGARLLSQGGNHGNIIIRYIRSRPGSTLASGVYGFDMENCHNVIIDHCSFSWANEECAAMYDTKNVTVQWSIVSEGLYNAGHAKGVRSYGGVWGGQYSTYHHNLIAHQQSRAIRFNGARAHDTIARIDYRNNVVYNSGNPGAAQGGEVEINGAVSQVNMVNNYYKPGPAESSLTFVTAGYNATLAKGVGKWYLSGNYLKGNTTNTSDNWTAVNLSAIPAAMQSTARSNIPFPLSGADIHVQTAEAAYESVLLKAGATLPVRDVVDSRIVSETATGTAAAKGPTSGKYGIIDSPSEVGGWPEYKSAIAPADNDHDGMPDDWETASGLNPDNADDRNTLNAEGYTMLEVYLNSISVNNAPPSIFQGFAVVATPSSELAADIKWTTLGEANLSKFIVERSADNKTFNAIKEVIASNKTSITEYLFTDLSTLGNTSYYRIKAVAQNDSISYTSTIKYFRAVLEPYWTEPFTTTTVRSIPIPATVATSEQDNGSWILYGARRDERSITSGDPNNQWSSGAANPSLTILNANAATTSTYSLTEAPYLITPILERGVSKITFNELIRPSISAGSIVVYTSTNGGSTWSATGINNQAKTSLFNLVTIAINSPTVNRLKIAKPAGVAMNIDNLTIYGFPFVKKEQSIDFAVLAQKTIGDPDFYLTASASSGLPVTFKSSDSTVAVITDNKVHITGPGTALITAVQTGNYLYLPTDTSQQLVVKALNLKISYADGDRGQGKNISIKPNFAIVNEDSVAVAYKELTVRYWFTPENYSGINTWIDYAEMDSSSVTANYVAASEPYAGALGYVEYSFNPSDSMLSALSTSGLIKSRFSNKDHGEFDESDDHSFMPGSSATLNNRMTIYRNGVLIWGTEPQKVAEPVKLKILSQNKNHKTTGNTIHNVIELINEGKTAVAYKDLSIRYWFTAEGDSPLNYWIDYAKLGSDNLSASFIKTPDLLSGADTYFEIQVPGADTLYALSSTGDIKFRLAKMDWSNFNEADDHSFKAAAAQDSNNHITVYHKGLLIFGTEPTARVNNTFASTSYSETNKNFGISAKTTVYPNPAEDKLFVSLAEETTNLSTLSLVNLAGSTVISQALTGRSATVDMSKIPAGIYILQLQVGNKVESIKITKH